MKTIIDLCFLCTKDYNCVLVNNKIVSEVEYVLPEITIFKLGVPLRICSICNEALNAFSKFKQFCLDNTQRLEVSIKESRNPGPPLYTDNSEQFYIEPERIEIFVKKEPLEKTPLDTQFRTEQSFENILPQNQLHTDINLGTGTNYDKTENIFIKKDQLKETQDRKICNNIIQDPLKEECLNNSVYYETVNYKTNDTSVTLNTDTNFDKAENIFVKEEHLELTPHDKQLKIECLNNSVNNKNNTSAKKWNDSFVDSEEITENKLNRNNKPHETTNLNCPVCKISYSDEFSLIQHIKLHVEQTNFNCEPCNKEFPLQTYIKYHVIHKTIKVKDSFKCNICCKLWSSKSHLERHMVTHSGVKDFQCKICNKSFGQNSILGDHMKSHSESKDFYCDICNKSFKFRSNLFVHRKTHSEVKDFRCDICSKTFTYKSRLKEHMKIHTGVKDLHCKICEKSFKCRSNLFAHRKTHSEVKDFRCDVCNKTFTFKSSLNDHMKIHTGVKDFHCEICKKSFKCRSNLFAHMKTHSEVNYYQCDFCSKSFKLKNNLDEHLKSHSE